MEDELAAADDEPEGDDIIAGVRNGVQVPVDLV
jgi:hypothetical protein